MPSPERSRLFALLGDPEHPRVDLGVTLGTRSHRVPAVSETGSAYRTVGSHPAEDTVRTAHERASKAGAVTVRIGHEGPYQELSGTSVVATGYGPHDQALASLGIVGPTRMDYPGTMAAVRAVARYVSRILDEA